MDRADGGPLRLQDVSRPQADARRPALPSVDSAENGNQLTAKAFPAKGVHRREVSYSR